jgi:hypothetical protein
MPLTTASTFKPIAEAIGAADHNIQSTLDLGSGSSAAYKIKVARQAIGTESQSAADADFDDLNTYETSMRTLEKDLVTRVQSAVAAAITATQTYFLAETGVNFRDYFDGTTGGKTFTYSTDFGRFRTAWRRVRNEELIVPIGSVTKSTGVWPSSLTPDQSFSLPTLLEVRTGSLIGAASITLNLICVRSDNTNDLITLTIPANTADGTRYAIGGTQKYVSVTTVTASGGTNGDVLEVWLR